MFFALSMMTWIESEDVDDHEEPAGIGTVCGTAHAPGVVE